MKNTTILFLILVLSTAAYASIDSTVECEKKSCVQGSMAHWTVDVMNNINTTIIIEYVRMVDENAYSVAYYDAEKDKKLAPGDIYTYKFDQLIVSPPTGYTWYYKPCMRVRTEGSSESQFICRDGVKTFTVLPREKAQCFLNTDCTTNEFCEQYTLKCEKLECKEGESIKDHICMPSSTYKNISNTTKIAILAVITIVLIAIIAIIISMRTDDTEEDNWYGQEKKTRKTKTNKKKQKKQR